MASKTVKLPAALQPVEDLLLWRDIPKSAAALGVITALYLLLEWSGIPLLTTISNAGLVASLVALVWAVASRPLGFPGPADKLPAVLKTGVDEVAAKQLAEKLRVNLNKALAVVRRIATGEEPLLTLKAAAALFVIGWLGRLASPVGLLFTAVLLAFILPKVYELRKDDVDAGLETARSHAERHLTTAKSKVEEVVSRFTPRKGPPPAAADKTE
ncbi:hypothetical protein MNEG_11847 [Monoraphidium neglectum]|uniref:Reticulon-like protein n=1 Tax=Monoraphidium neglectum TaxID=145388 RepID=A0A0D2MN00_9CHLO|nr:hypothetical protein MNEG_11847 [Monoraphidium neglectum]KIY96115.1 hypothetical protein MNEG_11847 [Monoraphidium neglectum]|eukprot:XP_013895135.1 hypothetical protein MNEG_11847 [Monoraphidium neglectum]